MKEVGNAIKEYLISRGITQKSLAERFGCSSAYINRLLNGQSNFGKSTAREWADEFGFSVSFLLTGEGTLIEKEGAEDAPVGEVTHPDETSDIPLLKERMRNEALQSQVNQLQAQLAEAYKRIGVLEASMDGNAEGRNAEAI